MHGFSSFQICKTAYKPPRSNGRVKYEYIKQGTSRISAYPQISTHPSTLKHVRTRIVITLEFRLTKNHVKK